MRPCHSISMKGPFLLSLPRHLCFVFLYKLLLITKAADRNHDQKPPACHSWRIQRPPSGLRSPCQAVSPSNLTRNNHDSANRLELQFSGDGQKLCGVQSKVRQTPPRRRRSGWGVRHHLLKLTASVFSSFSDFYFQFIRAASVSSSARYSICGLFSAGNSEDPLGSVPRFSLDFSYLRTWRVLRCVDDVINLGFFVFF